MFNFFKARKTNNNLLLKKKIERINLTDNFKELLISIIDYDFEKTIAIYTTICLNKNIINERSQKKINRLLLNKEVLIIMKKAKSRYYECFLSFVTGDFKKKLEKQLYQNYNEQLNYIRKELKIGYNEDFFKDRIIECNTIFNFNEIPYITKNIIFEKLSKYNVSNDKDLFKGLIEITPYYFLRKMQIPTLYDFKRVFKIITYKKTEIMDVLDYGCGAADLSLFLAKKGHNITLCDIEKGNLDAARKRFEIRSLNVKYIGSNFNNPIPIIRGKYDLIIAIEVLEHMRDPFKLLKLFNNLLKNEGIIMLGSFPFLNTNSEGDHLIESVSKREELLSWINKKWIKLNIDDIGNTFYKKKL